jgi:hypothetical protein
MVWVAIEFDGSVFYYTVEELLQQLKRRADVPAAKPERPGLYENGPGGG